MPIPVYSTQFGFWQDETGVVAVVNETSSVWVIRQITMYNGNLAEVVTATVADGRTNAVFFAANRNGDPGPWYETWEGRVVIPPSTPDVSQGFAWVTSGFPIDVYIGGYTLPGS